MMLYRISLDGCDDQTVLSMELTPDEAALVGRLMVESQNTSTMGCQPTLSIEIDEEGNR